MRPNAKLNRPQVLSLMQCFQLLHDLCHAELSDPLQNHPHYNEPTKPSTLPDHFSITHLDIQHLLWYPCRPKNCDAYTPSTLLFSIFLPRLLFLSHNHPYLRGNRTEHGQRQKTAIHVIACILGFFSETSGLLLVGIYEKEGNKKISKTLAGPR